MQRDVTWLLDILQRARLIQQFTDGLSESAFLADLMRREAVIRQIEVIGEAVRRLSDDFQAQHPDIPWTQIAGMRSKIVHEYDRIRLDFVWQVVQDDIPAQIAQIEPLVPPPPDDPT